MSGEFDYAIVGAGPAGLVLSQLLARDGIDVVLRDLLVEGRGEDGGVLGDELQRLLLAAPPSADLVRTIADLGYLVVSMDNRGTPAPKGAAWRRAAEAAACTRVSAGSRHA